MVAIGSASAPGCPASATKPIIAGNPVSSATVPNAISLPRTTWPRDAPCNISMRIVPRSVSRAKAP